MGMRKVRNAKVTHVGRFPHYVYEPRNGVETLVGIEEQVQIVTEVTDLGPEYAREIVLRMSRTEALAHIRALTDAVQAGRDKELGMGLPDSEPERLCGCGARGTHGVDHGDFPDEEHEHVFSSPHSNELCMTSESCGLTYGEYRKAQQS